MTEQVLNRHYKSLAERYNDFLYYSPEFVRTLTSKMIEKLELRNTDSLVDLGCGTGMYSLDIIKQVQLRKVIAVDPYPEMLKQIPEDTDTNIHTVVSDALSFSKQPGIYDKILIKEAIHHIPEGEELFNCLFNRLRKGGILLLVHVPPEVEYPLFQKALDRCKECHADPHELLEQLKNTGFRVEQDFIDYAHSIPKQKYFAMVKNCYMSALTSLGEQEIIDGLVEMEKKYNDIESLEFIDHFDYLKAVK